MNLEDRVEQINGLIPALQAPALVAHVSNEIRLLTDRLVRADDEQTRGRIKALRDLINLPEARKRPLHKTDYLSLSDRPSKEQQEWPN
jgi:hypothetical protein